MVIMMMKLMVDRIISRLGQHLVEVALLVQDWLPVVFLYNLMEYRMVWLMLSTIQIVHDCAVSVLKCNW